MYYIDYDNKHFLITIKSKDFLDANDFTDLVTYLSSKQLHYKTEYNGYPVSYDVLEEMIQWFIKDSIEFNFSLSAIEQIEEIKKQYDIRELKIFRDRRYDSDFFTREILTDEIKHFEFQKEGIDWNLKRNVFLDADDMGLGKTCQTISTFSYLYYHNYIDLVFIIVPKGLSYHWKYEILQTVKLFNEEDIHIINNENKIKPFEALQNKKIIIVPNYLLPDVVISYKKVKKNITDKKRKSKKNERWKVESYFNLKELLNKKSICCVQEESHETKNIKAIKTKCIHALKPFFDYRFCLTATPNIIRFEDIYSQIYFLDKTIIPMCFNAFRLWISKSVNTRFGGLTIESYDTEKVKLVMEKTKYIMRQRLKEDIPEAKYKLHTKLYYLELTNLQKQLYRMIVEKELSVLQEEYDQITWKLLQSKFHLIYEVLENPLLLTKRKYDDDKLNMLLARYKIENDPKFIFLQSRVESIVDESNDKIIVYDYHPMTLDTLYEKFKEYNPLMIHGSMKIKDKEKDRKEKEYLFNTDPKHKIIFLSQMTSSQGINLNKMCNITFYYNVDPNTTSFAQSNERTNRINSTRDSHIEIPYYPNTIESTKIKLAQNRISFNDKLTKEVSQQELEMLLNGRM